MHYLREMRDSPSANNPERVRTGDRSERVTVYIDKELEAQAKKLAEARSIGLSTWIVGAIRRRVMYESKKAGAAKQ
jgi:predicted HicB family RNase H-like nuclease